MKKNKTIKIIIRTLFYQFLLIFIGISFGFMLHANYWGNRAPIIQRSINHIFNPVEYDKNIEEFLIKIGRKRLYITMMNEDGNFPNLFEIIKNSEYIEGEEWYNCQYQHVNKEGKLDIYDFETRIKWKPWELYYPNPEESYE